MAKTHKKPTEAVQGRYTPVPHALLDSVAFMGASHSARSLIFELMRQHDGKNNGHLHLSAKWLRGRGWRSNDGIQKAKTESLERGLIIKTREGGLNAGPDRYAVTWLPITNFVGLHIEPRSYHPGAYQLLGPFAQAPQSRKPGEQPPPTPPVVRATATHTVKQKCHPTHRDSAAPHTGVVSDSTAPHTGAREASFPDSLHRTPETMNSYHCTGIAAVARGDRSGRNRVVGKAGKSGKRPDTEQHHQENAPSEFWDSERGEFVSPVPVPPRKTVLG